MSYRRSRILIALVTLLSLIVPLLTEHAQMVVAASGNASINLTKTVTSTAVNPHMALALVADHMTAIPGDSIKYTATLTTGSATLDLGGTFTAQNNGNVAATVSSYYDDLEYYNNSTKTWTAFAVTSQTATGYTPVVKPPTAGTTLPLTVTPVPASGITYPGTGDSILGTQMATPATASWTYTISLPLTASLIQTLSSSTVGGVRNVVHVEVTPRATSQGQPFTSKADFTDPFQAGPVAVKNITIAITPPGASEVDFTPTTTPALASLGQNASVSVSTSFTVPTPAAKGAGMSNADYLAALKSIEGSTLTAKATASGTSLTGPVTVSSNPALTTEHLPILWMAKSGPASADAGATATYPLALQNNGGAAAGGLAITDTLPDGSQGTVSSIPSSLAAGASGTAQATYPIPASQPDGALTDTATLTWQDANGNTYGPISSSYSTTVRSSYTGATLTLAPQTAGPDVTGTSQTLKATLLDRTNSPMPNQIVTFAVTGPNATDGTATTDSSGVASFSYTGNTNGSDTVQATAAKGSVTLQSNTASVTWVTPVQTVSTTSVVGKFFANGGGYFSHTPADTPAFTQTFPTINFNPPAGTINNTPPGYTIGVTTRPFTDVTTDLASDYTGQVVAQGNGYQAGLSNTPLFTFDAEFTATFVVAKAGDIQFNFFSDDGFIFGVSGGATSVPGPNTVNVNTPATTPFQGYPVMGGFDDPTSPRATPVTVHFPAPGEYAYEVDYSECCGGELALTTANNATGHGIAPAGDLALTPATPPTQTVGQPVKLTVQAVDTSGLPVANLPVTLSITAGPNAQSPITLPTDAQGMATFSYVGTAAGTDHAQVAANVNGMPAVSNLVNVTWQLPSTSSGGGGSTSVASCTTACPVITNITPQDGIKLTKPVPVTASIQPSAGQTITSWKVTYGTPSGQQTSLASGTGTPPATLGTFDPTVLPNDTYAIHVIATDSGGGTQDISTTVDVYGDLKLGHFVQTFKDLAVPVNGFDMQVLRTYDSFDKQVGDFGYGWHVSLSNFRVRANRALGAGGWTMYDTQCFGICLTAFSSSTPHYVTVTWPDGHQEAFDATPGNGTNVFLSGTMAFTPRQGTNTTSTLQVDGDSGITYTYDGNLYAGDYHTLYNPQRYILTTKSGVKYRLDVNTGLVSETDLNGNSLTVDGTGVHASNGESITFNRDSQKRITDIYGPAGEHLVYKYDPATGDLSTYQDGAGNVTTFGYTGNHYLQSYTGPNATPLVTLKYGDDGRLQSIQHGTNPPELIQDNVAAQTETDTDPSGALATTYTFDDVGDVVREDRSADGQTLTTLRKYDANGNIVYKKDPMGHESFAQYDDKDNLIQYADADNHVEHLVYGGPHGEFTSIQLGPSLQTVFTLTYDNNGNLTQFGRPGTQPTIYRYDGAGRITEVDDPLGHKSLLQYDANGHVSQVQNDFGTSYYTMDAAGHIQRVKDAGGAVTNLTYDGDGNVTDVTDPNLNHTVFKDDSLGHVVRETDALGGHIDYQYDDAGRLHLVTDRDGRTITYSYDADGHPQSVTPSDSGALSFGYDGFGRLIEADNADAKVHFGHDANGELNSQTSSGTGTSNQPSVSLSYWYDGMGNRLGMTGPDGETDYLYDGLERLQTLTDPSQRQFQFSYDPLSRLQTLSRPNGISDTLAYNDTNDLTSRVASLSGTAVASAAYGYESPEVRRSETDLTGLTTYQHDPVGQLLSATGPSGTESYQYDPAGNRIASPTSPIGTMQYDADNRLTSDAAYSYLYNNEGNLTQKTNTSTGAATKYDWNALHQLRAIHYADGSTTTYRYDALGRRIEVNDNGTITRYAYDGDNIHLEYDSTNQVVATYTDQPGIDHPLEMVRGGQPYYYLVDGNGSTTALTDSTGRVADSYQYDPYGQQTATGSVSNPFTFTGREYDAKSGLYYYRARYYDPATGRFLGQDPLPSSSPYMYASNDPVDYVDPTGASDEEYGEILSNLPEEFQALARHAIDVREGDMAENMKLAILRSKDGEVGGWSGWPNPTVPDALESTFADIANSVKAAGNWKGFMGKCAEVDCVIQAFDKGYDLNGATITVIRWIDGTEAAPCSFCEAMLQRFNVTPNP